MASVVTSAISTELTTAIVTTDDTGTRTVNSIFTSTGLTTFTTRPEPTESIPPVQAGASK